MGKLALVSGAEAAQSTGQSVVKGLSNEKLAAWASMLGVKVVERRADIEGRIVPLESLGGAWCFQRGVLPLKDGRIFATSQEYVTTAREILANKAAKISVIPTRWEAFADLLEELFTDNEAVVSDTEKSDVQLRYTRLIEQALNENASDIHIEVRPAGTVIRLRQHGILKDLDHTTYKTGMAFAQVLFNVAADSGRSVYDPRKPQDASTLIDVNGTAVRLRLASMPAHPDGVDVVMRVLAANRTAVGLGDLGYADDHIRIIKGGISRPHGIILVAGPTGSGKSTTLASMVMNLQTDEKTITIEDPPEYELHGRTQVPADTQSPDRNFAAMARATLRMDPDNIMIGEIRDEETARMAVRAAITGHRVFSTVHAKSAISIVTRLVDFGISPSMLADPDLLVCLIYQRLVPAVCPHCSIPLKEHSGAYAKSFPALYERLLLALNNKNEALAGVRIHNRKGCGKCQNTGVAGRTVVAEAIYMDAKGRGFIEHGQFAEWEHHLAVNNWRPLRAHVIEKIRAGIISPDDAERVVGSLAEAQIGESFDYGGTLNKLGG